VLLGERFITGLHNRFLQLADILYQTPDYTAFSQTFAHGKLGCLLDVTGLKFASQINNAPHPSLPGTAFLVKQRFTEFFGMGPDLSGPCKQIASLPGGIEYPVCFIHKNHSLPGAFGMSPDNFQCPGIYDLNFKLIYPNNNF